MGYLVDYTTDYFAVPDPLIRKMATIAEARNMRAASACRMVKVLLP